MYPIKAVTIINNKMTTLRLNQFVLNMEKNSRRGKCYKTQNFMNWFQFLKVDCTICGQHHVH
jgi:hypothetical protein